MPPGDVTFRRGLAVAVAGACAAAAGAMEPVAIDPAHRLPAGAPAWRDLGEKFTAQPDAVADFEEKRFFPFRHDPVILKGEVRVSRQHGLSLHYTAPEERIVILDDRGMVVRDAAGQQSPPDARAGVGNRALLHVLRLDFAALEKDFEVYGRRDADAWSIALVPREEALRRTLGNIHVTGEGTAVRTIELRRSPKQHIDIAMAAPRAKATFTADEVKSYFR